jgi:hypothetical protein
MELGDLQQPNFFRLQSLGAAGKKRWPQVQRRQTVETLLQGKKGRRKGKRVGGDRGHRGHMTTDEGKMVGKLFGCKSLTEEKRAQKSAVQEPVPAAGWEKCQNIGATG